MFFRIMFGVWADKPGLVLSLCCMSESLLMTTPDEQVRFDTKIVIVVRADLAVWQKLNMTAFLASGVAAQAPESIGKPYRDADDTDYLSMFVQPTMVFEAAAEELRRTLARALARGIVPAVFTADLFA